MNIDQLFHSALLMTYEEDVLSVMIVYIHDRISLTRNHDRRIN